MVIIIDLSFERAYICILKGWREDKLSLGNSIELNCNIYVLCNNLCKGTIYVRVSAFFNVII